MSVGSLVAAWNRFFFAPQSPLPIALFRALYGMLVIADLILLRPDWLTWYGTHAWMSIPTMFKVEPGLRLNLFTVMPESDLWIEALFWVFLISAVLLAIGFLTRVNSVIVFLCLASIHQRNLYITNSGDTFMRVAGFFLMFAPAGAAFSMDRLMRVRQGKEGPQIRPRAPWAQRMIQFELALLYFTAFCWKSTGAVWLNGTALYYVYHLDEIRRFPTPLWLQSPLAVELGSWLTLAIEFALGILVWFKELRYPVLLIGLLFHAYLEYSINVPLFQWIVVSAYVLFINPDDLMRVWDWVRERAAGWRAVSRSALPR